MNPTAGLFDSWFMFRFPYHTGMKECKLCNTAIPPTKDSRQEFCNRSCAATFNGRKRRRPPKLCINCKINPVKKNASTYCSISCQHKYQWSVVVKKIEETKICSEPRRAKKYLKGITGEVCSLCGRTEHTSAGKVFTIPLILDHIDGNSDNWSLANLRLVCGCCDMLLPTYKKRNYGNGRHKRRERYAQGKSY